MEFWLCAVSVSAAMIIAALVWKLYLLKKSAREITAAFSERLTTETNTLIDLSSRDRDMKRLANELNRQLRTLNEKRLRYDSGDAELKSAVTNISHDLRTPLTAIRGYLDLLEGEELTVDATRYIEVIRSRTESLCDLTSELFRYSTAVFEPGSDKPACSEIVLNRALEESIAGFYAALIERGITPEVRITDRRITRLLDESLLSRILMNILSNALKYSDGDLLVVLSDSGEISFSNRATGLDTIQTERLFERFYTVENAGKSTGLGLSIARKLTERMNGEIHAEYKDDRLYVRLRFPE